METGTLPRWYRRNGRHALPWRLTRDPWAVLVSEVMLQQTSVARVSGRWQAFLARWPSPEACAAAPLEDVLREWQGLGYPRRARALWLTAAAVARNGWPTGEAGLLALPGVGRYTARAMRWITTTRPGCPPPSDVNIARVAARAAHGAEAWQVAPALIDQTIEAGRPAGMSRRDYVYALFDAGAQHCRATPSCAGCPFAESCASRARLAAASPPPPPRRQARYSGSMRQLRGAILRSVLAGAEGGIEVSAEAEALAAAHGLDLTEAVAGLARDGLIATAAPREQASIR